MNLSPEDLGRLQSLLGRRPLAQRAVGGGYTTATRAIVSFDDGSSAFVKLANDELTAGWLRDEWRIYNSVTEPFMPRVFAWEDGDFPLLALEDLSGATWPTSWTGAQIDAVLETLSQLRKCAPPEGLRTLESYREDFLGWEEVARDPAPFLSLGLCSEAWLKSALPALVKADKDVVLTGSEFLHLDIRSDNICFDGNRVVFVDWNWACVGNARADIVFWLPSLACEGGAVPQEIIDEEPDLVTMAAGFWAKRAGLPPPSPGSKVRELQTKQLRVALPWVARVLGLDGLDGLNGLNVSGA